MIQSLLPPDMGWHIALALMGTSFCTSMLTAAFGTGGGAILLAVLATLLPATALIPVHGVVQLGSNTGRALVMLPHLARGILVSFLIGSVVGIGLGGVLVTGLPPAVLRLGIGLFLIWSLLAKPPAFIRRSAWLAGGFSSFLTMFFGATGPFVSAYVKALGTDRLTYVATHAACMTTQHLLKVIAFGLLGFAFGPYLGIIAGMVVFGFAGTLTGRQVLLRIDERRFRFVLNASLAVLAANLIWEGVAALAWQA